MQYEGCLLLVSHDRYFMDKCVDSLFILEADGNISGFVGKCSEYIEGEVSPSLQPAALRQAQDKPQGQQSSATPSNGAAKTPDGPVTPQSSTPKKLSFKEQKEFETLDAEIPALEAEQKELEPLMSSSDFSVVSTASNRYNEITKLLEQKYPRWEELAERI